MTPWEKHMKAQTVTVTWDEFMRAVLKTPLQDVKMHPKIGRAPFLESLAQGLGFVFPEDHVFAVRPDDPEEVVL